MPDSPPRSPSDRSTAPDRQLILASASPRRRLLLPLLGFTVKAQATDVDEEPLPGETGAAMVRRLSETKARAVGFPPAGQVVVGSDTAVELEGQLLGKPANAIEARQMLGALRGRWHQVLSGIYLLGGQASAAGLVATSVEMRRYSDAELECYVASGRPLDKAGAYAIQDRDFGPVAQIDGCYLNVVGLPLCEVSRGLRALGWSLPDEVYRPPCRWCRLGQAALEPAGED